MMVDFRRPQCSSSLSGYAGEGLPKAILELLLGGCKDSVLVEISFLLLHFVFKVFLDLADHPGVLIGKHLNVHVV